MFLREIISEDARVFLKSEWAPISKEWPALSFTQPKVGRKLRAELTPSRDVVVYVGTSNPEFTLEERHRQRLLSVLRVEPHHDYATEDLVPRESWLRAQQRFHGRFLYSVPVLKAWEFEDFPAASDFVPNAYRGLGNIRSWGDIVAVDSTEKNALLNLGIREIELQLQSVVDRIQELTQMRDLPLEENQALVRMERFINDPEDPVNGELARIVALINGRVARSGTLTTHSNPWRNPPPEDVSLILLLKKNWFAQNKRCALCLGKLVANGSNPLLQPSPDRIDSRNPNYDETNLSITHLACNLAKNKHTTSQFEEWLAVLRGGL